MGDRAAKDQLFESFASVAKALASGRRTEIVDVLAQGERSVEELATEIGQSVANTSHHLQTLARGGMVRSQRRGTRVIYRLASERVGEMWSALRDIATQHAPDVERSATAYLGDRDDVTQISATELAAKLDAGRVVVLDVRPTAEYRAGHIAGARSVPIGDLSELMPTLPARSEVVAYCRGPYCVYADDAVRLLRSHGVRARRLDTGFPEWRRAGLPVTQLDDR